MAEAWLGAGRKIGLRIKLCCGDLEWMLGQIVKYKPRAKKFNFDVHWKSGRPEQQGLKLAAYYDGSSTPVPGNWVYIERARTGTIRRLYEIADEAEGDIDMPAGPAPRGP